MPHGADLKTIRREIAFSAILITGMLLEIWITLYREFNYDFSNTPEILPIAQYLIGLCIIVSFILRYSEKYDYMIFQADCF